MPCQVGGLGPPCPRLLPPFVLARVAFLQCPSLGKEQVALLCLPLTQKLCIQQYPIGSQMGLVDFQWGGFLHPDCCSMGGLPFFNFVMAFARLMMIFACCWFITTSLSMYHSSGWTCLPSCQAMQPLPLPGLFPVQLPDWRKLSRWRSWV